MKTCNYINAPLEVAERLNIADMCPSAGEGRVIITESDLRMLDMTNEEKIQFFGCEVLTEQKALELADKNKKNLSEQEIVESEKEEMNHE